MSSPSWVGVHGLRLPARFVISVELPARFVDKIPARFAISVERVLEGVGGRTVRLGRGVSFQTDLEERRSGAGIREWFAELLPGEEVAT